MKHNRPSTTRPPFFEIQNSLFHDGIVREIGPLAFTGYSALQMHADKHGECFPSQTRIPELTVIRRTKVVEYLKVLEKHRLIKKGKRGRFNGNKYTVSCSPPEQLSEDSCSPREHELFTSRTFSCSPRGLSKRTIPNEPDSLNQEGAADTDPFDGVEFPESLNVPEVREALTRWCAYRRVSKLKAWAPRTLKTKPKQFAEVGPSQLVAAVERYLTRTTEAANGRLKLQGSSTDRARAAEAELDAILAQKRKPLVGPAANCTTHEGRNHANSPTVTGGSPRAEEVGIQLTRTLRKK